MNNKNISFVSLASIAMIFALGCGKSFDLDKAKQEAQKISLSDDERNTLKGFGNTKLKHLSVADQDKVATIIVDKFINVDAVEMAKIECHAHALGSSDKGKCVEAKDKCVSNIDEKKVKADQDQAKKDQDKFKSILKASDLDASILVAGMDSVSKSLNIALGFDCDDIDNADKVKEMQVKSLELLADFLKFKPAIDFLKKIFHSKI